MTYEQLKKEPVFKYFDEISKIPHGSGNMQKITQYCLDFAKEIAIKENCYKIMLSTSSKEEATLNFYRKAGYNSEDKTAFVQWL